MTPDDIEHTTVFYFGVWGQPGHALWTPQRVSVRGDGEIPDIFTPKRMDGRFCRASIGHPWKGDEPEGLAFLHHVEISGTDAITDAPFVGQKWTVLAFPDRSGSERNGSNSAFIANRVCTFAQMTILARSHFPDIWKRMRESFEIVDIKSLK